MRFAAKSKLAVVALTALLGQLVAVPSAEARAEDCQSISDMGTLVPVLFVHGLLGRTGTWQAGNPSMDAEVRTIEEISIVDAFDYEDYHLRWVDDDNIGPRLARTIACYAQASREQGGPGKVIVVAHSMGGLATRYAATYDLGDGRTAAPDIGLVVTIGTPNLGSHIAGDLFWLAHTACIPAMIPRTWGASIQGTASCAEKLEAVEAMQNIVNSDKLQQLSLIPTDIPVIGIAGDVHVTVPLLFATIRMQGSDMVVPVQSAAFGSETRVVECEAHTPVPILSDGSCEHTHQLTDQTVQQHVVDAIQQYLRSLETQTAAPCPTLQEADELLAVAMNGEVGFAHDEIVCQNDWAVAIENTTSSGKTLFHFENGAWIFIGLGSSWSADRPEVCAQVPEQIKTALSC